MKRYLPILPIVALSIALQAQTASTSGAANAAGNATANVSRAAAQTNEQGNAAASANAARMAGSRTQQAAASATEATSVSAELTKKLDTKNAKVGDEVLARTTKTATLADGTKLPRGTKLIGKVTEVQARSRAEKTSHIAFALDHAVMRDGREVPVHAVLTSVTGASALAGSNDDLSASSPMGGVAGGGNAQGIVRAPGGGGGLLGGVGSPVGGVVGGASNTVGEAGGAVRSGAGSVMNETQAAGGAVANVGASGSLDHVPVANLPGVMLSSSAETASSGSLDAKGKNIDLESGTKMTLAVSEGQQ